MPPEQAAGREMDLHNNKIGREIGEALLKNGKFIMKDYIDAVFDNKDRLQVDEKTGNWGRWWAK